MVCFLRECKVGRIYLRLISHGNLSYHFYYHGVVLVGLTFCNQITRFTSQWKYGHETG